MTITTKPDYFRELSIRTGKTMKELEEIKNIEIDMIKELATQSDSVKVIIPGLGYLHGKPQASYIGRNPITGQDVAVMTQMRYHLKLSQSLLNEIKNSKK